MELPKRKPTRLQNYDYSQQNLYFVTICTSGKKCLFGNVGALNEYGKIAEKCLKEISAVYKDVCVDQFVVMPNHVHALITIENSVSLSQVVGQYKMSVTKAIHRYDKKLTVWQRSFYDHVVRNQEDYQRIWTYIVGNPQSWYQDNLYVEEAEY